ncbi:alpha/beta hydrolase [Leucobacter massiliensis]|uniref:DUF1023 domain-containing protein n=1 Tax=Leucobacter massiliensis TaxID=1686285 RepID=A0A2S9QKH4_9MICO|nr:alpha/beta hydrolase [Leucobacter massiliensis]PRI10087.1 hypothetical protein B4915_13190 [Leucobacter massiliensis]
MTAGQAALAGDPDAVRQAGSQLQWRTVGTGVYTQLNAAAGGLGGQSGNAIAVERVLTMIQATSAPANLMQSADGALGGEIASYGGQMHGIAERARRAQQDLASAEGAVTAAQRNLRDFDRADTDEDDAWHRRLLVSSVTGAQERVSAAKLRLQELDEERRGADSSASSSISAQRSVYVSARNAMPEPPRVSANVRVSATMPDGSVRSVTALELAKLGDPAQIRAVWDALSAEQRAQLIGDAPLLLGNLEGIPLRDRNTANVITAQSYRDELEQQIKMLKLLQKQQGMSDVFADKITDLQSEVKSIDAMLGDRNWKYRGENGADGQPFGTYKIFDENGVDTDQNGLVLVGFNPWRDSYITFQGALDPQTGDVPAWMEQVGVVVPGTNSRLAGFTADLDRGQDLYKSSGTRSGYFTWHGAPMPRFDPPGHITDAAQRGFADTAAPRLASFVNSLSLPANVDVVPIAHSYGAAVLGGAEYLGLRADRVVYVAPAGLGHNVSGIDEFPNTKDVPHFVLQARNDLVVGWNQGKAGFGLGHGPTNPLEADGVVRLETGFLKHGDPGSGTIESPGGMETHSTPFRPDSTSMRNITNVVTGDPVSIYHENDTERVRTGGRVPRSIVVEVQDSGAAKPEELISPIDLERVP